MRLWFMLPYATRTHLLHAFLAKWVMLALFVLLSFAAFMEQIKNVFWRWVFLFFLLPATGYTATAQRTTAVNEEFWWGLITNTQVTEKWSWWNDFHFVNNLFFIYRTGATYTSPSSRWVSTGGYSILKLGAPFSDGSLVRTEHRPWFQTIYRVPASRRISTSFRFRYDARFLANLGDSAIAPGFSFNSRWRFNNALRYAWGNRLSRHFNFTTSMLNESLITTGPGPNGVPFEHRSHLMLAFNKKDITLNTGYVVRFLAINPSLLRINHGPVIWLTINLRPKWMTPKMNLESPGDYVD